MSKSARTRGTLSKKAKASIKKSVSNVPAGKKRLNCNVPIATHARLERERKGIGYRPQMTQGEAVAAAVAAWVTGPATVEKEVYVYEKRPFWQHAIAFIAGGVVVYGYLVFFG